jgi:Protein of unknown function (DUF3261)
LLSPASYGRAFATEQFLEGDAPGQHFQLRTYIEIDADEIRVLGFTPWQTRAFILRYDGNRVTFENFTNREMPFAPAMILSDIQQVLWPHLPNQGQWRVSDDPQSHERRVYFRGQLITHIQYNENFPTRGDVELINQPFAYRLRIQTLQSWH